MQVGILYKINETLWCKTEISVIIPNKLLTTPLHICYADRVGAKKFQFDRQYARLLLEETLNK